MMSQKILPRPTLVAIATKFETKWAITQLVWEISPRCLGLVEGFRFSDRTIECERNSTTSDPVAVRNFKQKRL